MKLMQSSLLLKLLHDFIMKSKSVTQSDRLDVEPLLKTYA